MLSKAVLSKAVLSKAVLSKAVPPDGSPRPTAATSGVVSRPADAILVTSSALPVAPRAARVSDSVPPSAASTSSAPGASRGPSGPWATPMMIASACAARGASWLVRNVAVTDPSLVPARPRGLPLVQARHPVVAGVGPLAGWMISPLDLSLVK